MAVSTGYEGEDQPLSLFPNFSAENIPSTKIGGQARQCAAVVLRSPRQDRHAFMPSASSPAVMKKDVLNPTGSVVPVACRSVSGRMQAKFSLQIQDGASLAAWRFKLPADGIRLIICLWMSICVPVSGLELQSKREDVPVSVQKPLSPQGFIPVHPKRPLCLFNTDAWRARIDSTWGEGLPAEQKLEIFDRFWNVIDRKFACFQDLDVDWNALRALYRPEVENNVSRGRFAAIMNHMALALKESHTYIDDRVVNWNTAPAPGIPLLCVGGWGDAGHFGAGLTPLPDSTLLVYKTVPSHPLGLKPGDIVLGYNGIPWKHLYPDLIKAQLPLYGRWWGCSESAYGHSWLMAAGLNWHLFEVIDVIQFEGGDTLHLSTEPMRNQSMHLFCSEQVDVPGVPMLEMDEFLAGKAVSFGILEGTRIGYVYVWGWYGDAEEAFYHAVDSLINKSPTEGLIIDFRTNFGGNMLLSNKGLELLFNQSVSTIGFVSRSDPDDHLSMRSAASPGDYVIPGNPYNHYGKPLAVLTGPGARSSGDQVALRMTFHPMARLFGRPTTASFNSPAVLEFRDYPWSSAYAEADAYLVTRPGHYLTHDEFKVDEKVWLTPEDVARGHDTVVEAAAQWIHKTTNAFPDPVAGHYPGLFRLGQNYPNPFNPTTTIPFFLPWNSSVCVQVFDVRGREAFRVLDEGLGPGENSIPIDASGLPGGIYYYRIKSGGFICAKKMVVLK
jgi:hypothetical protein